MITLLHLLNLQKLSSQYLICMIYLYILCETKWFILPIHKYSGYYRYGIPVVCHQAVKFAHWLECDPWDISPKKCTILPEGAAEIKRNHKLSMDIIIEKEPQMGELRSCSSKTIWGWYKNESGYEKREQSHHQRRIINFGSGWTTTRPEWDIQQAASQVQLPSS